MSWLPDPRPDWLTSLIACTIGVVLLWNKSSSFRYTFKFTIYFIHMQLCSLLIIPCALFYGRDCGNFDRFGGITYIRQTTRLLGVKWDISGSEVLAADIPFILITNHQSVLDGLAFLELLSIMKKCAGISKKSTLFVFPAGLMLWLCGVIFINRSNSKESQEKVTKLGEKIRKDKTKLWICPEGTRAKEDNLLPFKKGAFHIAIQQKIPIVPAVISPYTFVDDDKKIFDSGTVKIRVLNPIDTSNLQYPEDISKLSERCYELMNMEFQKLREEMQAQ